MVAPRPRNNTDYRGRFAPSPTGPLHIGSLTAAVASYLQARTSGGSWLLRIEDIDPPREIPGAAADQVDTLGAFGMVPDEPVAYQSRSHAIHNRALARLRAAGRAYDCGCSRRDLPASGIYPGTCRNGIPAGRAARSIRFRVPAATIEFEDRIFGACGHRLDQTCGDFVIRRADGLIAYQLAVVVDDIESGITEVVRGSDLLNSSPRQQALYDALQAPTPGWMHLPLIVDRSGAKLSKSSRADPVDRHAPRRAMVLALTALGHPPPAGLRSLEALWQWARRHWEPARVPREPFEV